jgi:hypothetical protein
MIARAILFAIVCACVWGVLNPRLETRTLGTLALSLIAMLAVVFLLC